MNTQISVSGNAAVLHNKRSYRLLPMPYYTRLEESLNTISHLAGILFSLFVSGWALKTVTLNPTNNKFLAVIIYSLSLLILYSTSTIYHGLPKGYAKQLFRVFDHCTIYILIAGCYTPFCLIAFHGESYGIALLAAEWILAAVGIAANLFDMNAKPVRIFSQASYVIMGWLIVFMLNKLLTIVSLSCVIWLVIGGISYTAGIIFYALGSKVRYMHCIWHLFVLLGSACQFFSILQLL